MPQSPPDNDGHREGRLSERLQKILAAAGFGSRRQCEELITSGRVEVDRQVVSSLGTKANLDLQEIRVDGQRLRKPKPVYYVVNKPRGVVCTNRDPTGRPRVVDFVPDRDRVFSVGRLDISSEGLILLTNDGDLANRLAHPRFGVEKTYLAEVAGTIGPRELSQLRRGVHLAEGFAHAVSVQIKKQHGKSTSLEIVLDEGRNREVRRLLARVGHKVLRLTRIALGPLRLGQVPPGAYRLLTRGEVAALRQDATPAAHRARLERRRVQSAKRAAERIANENTPPAAPPSAVPADDVVAIEVLDTSRPAQPRTIIGAESPPRAWRQVPGSRHGKHRADPEPRAAGSEAAGHGMLGKRSTRRASKGQARSARQASTKLTRTAGPAGKAGQKSRRPMGGRQMRGRQKPGQR